jgi:hypothetical protein
MLYAFFWAIPRCLNFICRRFGTLCLFRLHRQVGVKNSLHLPAYEDWTECSETSAYNIQTPGNCPEESIQQLQAHVKEPLEWHVEVLTTSVCYCGCLCLYWVSIMCHRRQILVSVFSSCPAPHLSFEIFPLSCSFTWHSWHTIFFYKTCDDVLP